MKNVIYKRMVERTNEQTNKQIDGCRWQKKLSSVYQSLLFITTPYSFFFIYFNLQILLLLFFHHRHRHRQHHNHRHDHYYH